MNSQVKVGIAGIGIYLPGARRTAKEISQATLGRWSEDAVRQKLGINEIRVAGDALAEGTQEMGALAAIECVKDAGVDPKEIDAILCFGEEYKEFPLTTSACYIQDRVGAVNAWGIDVQNRCCTTVAAMKMAKDMLIADENCNYVLVCGGYRNGDLVDYADNDMSMMYNLSAGGGAVLLKKNHDRNLLLGTHLISDGSISRTAGVEIGGLVNPITPENYLEARKSLRLMEPAKMKARLNAVSMDNWMKCIHEAFCKSGLPLSELGYLDILHMKRSGHEDMVRRLGITPEQTVYLEDYGHVGQVDQILSLKLGLEQGKIQDGTVIAMIAAGIGYVWAANVIKWGGECA